MIENAKVARDDLVLQDGARWNVDSVSMIRNYDHSSLETDILAEGYVPRNCEMIGFQHVRDCFETTQEFGHLFEVFVAQLDQWGGFELSIAGHDQRARLQLIKVGHDKHEIRSLLNGKKAGTRDVDSDRIVEVLDRRS